MFTRARSLMRCWLAADSWQMSTNLEQRKLAAIMFTDMVGYSALSQRDDKLAQELLEEQSLQTDPRFAPLMRKIGFTEP